MASELASFSEALAGIVAAAAPQVVSVSGRRHYPSSGILWGEGVVVTADHALRRDEGIKVTLADGKVVAADLAGRDAGSDLAVLKLAGGGGSAAPRPAAAVKPGELALVVGRSPESGVNASFGIVSAVSGPWRTWRGGKLEQYIRLDAHLFPHSSGGAVVNVRGELIGVATGALSRLAGLAIPSATVARVAPALIASGRVPQAFLGLGVQPVRGGLIVLQVEPKGPADQAGVLVGDILTAADGSALETIDDLQALLDSAAIGKAVKLRLLRGGEAQEAALTVGERPSGKD